MAQFLSTYQCDFRKGFSAQDCLLAMLKNRKEQMIKGNVFGVPLIDLLKAFDCLSHELIIAKRNVYAGT